MKLHEILNEEAAEGSVSAEGIAGTKGSLFGGGDVTHLIKRLGITKNKVDRLAYAKDPTKPLFKLIDTTN